MLTALVFKQDKMENKKFLFKTKFSIHSDRQQSKSISLVTLNMFEETIVFITIIIQCDQIG